MQALRSSRFRWLLLVATVATSSIWVSNIAILIGLLERGGPGSDVGLFQAAWTAGVPIAIIVAGLTVDRAGPWIALVVALVVEVGALLALASASVTGTPDLTTVLLLTLLLGMADGSLVVPVAVLAGIVVDTRHMGSAISLLLIPVGIGRIVGGLLGGQMVAVLGVPTALVLSAIAVGVGVLLTGSLRAVGSRPHDAVASAYLDLRPGLRWYRGRPDAVTVLALGALMAACIYAYFSVLPLVIADTMGPDARYLGLITALGGAGVIAAAVTMDRIGRWLGTGRLLVVSVLASAMGLVLLGGSHTVVALGVSTAFLPIATNVHAASTSHLLQYLSALDIRGRVLGVYGLVFAGLLPVGAFMAGWLGDRIGPRETLVVLGVVSVVVAAALVAFRPGIVHRDASTAAEGSTSAEAGG